MFKEIKDICIDFWKVVVVDLYRDNVVQFKTVQRLICSYKEYTLFGLIFWGIWVLTLVALFLLTHILFIFPLLPTILVVGYGITLPLCGIGILVAPLFKIVINVLPKIRK